MATYTGTLTGGAVTTITDSGFDLATVTNAYNNATSGPEDSSFHVTIDGSTPTSSTGLTVGPTQKLFLSPLVTTPTKPTTIKILCANSLAYSVTTYVETA